MGFWRSAGVDKHHRPACIGMSIVVTTVNFFLRVAVDFAQESEYRRRSQGNETGAVGLRYVHLTDSAPCAQRCFAGLISCICNYSTPPCSRTRHGDRNARDVVPRHPYEIFGSIALGFIDCVQSEEFRRGIQFSFCDYFLFLFNF